MKTEETGNKASFRFGKAPKRDGRQIAFGSFPQSRKEEGVAVSSAPDAADVYEGSDGEKYVLFNGQYFKIEPILWWILSEENGTALLLSDKVLAAMRFDAKSRVYEESEVRAWLNGTFYGQAFGEAEKEYILPSEVGSKRSAPFVTDRVYLPYGEADVFKKSGGLYGGPIDKTKKFVTPYAFAMGGDPFHAGKDPYAANKETFWDGSCDYWLRKSCTRGKGNVFAVAMEGGGIYCYPLDEKGGVVPEIRIRLPR